MWSSGGSALLWLRQLWAEAALLVGLCLLLSAALVAAPELLRRGWRSLTAPNRTGRGPERCRPPTPAWQGGEADIIPEMIKGNIVGEMAFQLDRRILCSIFPDRDLLYGLTVSNITEKITQGGNFPLAPENEEQRKCLMERYSGIMKQLKPLGYDPNVHPTFTKYLVNTYGVLPVLPNSTPEKDTFNNVEFLQNVISTVVPAEKVEHCRVLLSCLSHLSEADGKPFFSW